MSCLHWILRRLAIQSRHDQYVSRRDYQEISTMHPTEISFNRTDRDCFLTFIKSLNGEEGNLLGFGCYLRLSTYICDNEYRRPHEHARKNNYDYSIILVGFRWPSELFWDLLQSFAKLKCTCL